MSRLVAHAGGMGWDEMLVFALPVVILVVLQVLGRRKREEAGSGQDDGEGEGAG